MNGFVQFLLLSAAVCGASALNREKREDCGAQFATYAQCISQAASSISSVPPTGDPDQIAKQGCNIIESISACKNKLSGGCFNDEVSKMMKQQMDGMISNLANIPGWDSKKCKAVQDYLHGGSAMQYLSIPLLTMVLARLFL